MSHMGRIQGRQGAVVIRQPGPDRINPLQLEDVLMAS